VIAGTARGIRLRGPGEGTRPLGDRAKQSLFAILEPTLRGTTFVDLYAGSGAAGIEALSRGAARAIFVERDGRAAAAVAGNLQATGLTAGATVIRAAVAAWLGSTPPRGLEDGPAGTVFADPPYDEPAELDRSLAAVDLAGPGVILASGGTVVAKHSRQASPAATRLLRSVRRERFGDTILTFLRWADEVDA
jgi:16S rRNA (guanine966-N2)-methyltransferase